MVKMVSDPRYSKVILLGLDGLDPKVLSPLMRSGRLPNFLTLSKTGLFSPLATSNPAQSPVAWASLATGSNPGYHGIFDFLNRRVTDYMPELAIVKVNPKNVFAKREAMFLPVMHGYSFWDHLAEKDIPTTVLKWPMTFQPRQTSTKLFAGLGVPDIKGGLGKYAFYTSRDIPQNSEGYEKVIKIHSANGLIKTYVYGPNIAKLMSRELAKIDMVIRVLTESGGVEISIDGKKFTLQIGQWSKWVEITFKLGMMKTTSGIVKFYLKKTDPEFELYMTPVQINPKEPAFIISSPDEYVKELAHNLGCFYTLGMPEDTKALEEGRTDEEAFIGMCDEIVDEQEKMLRYEMNRFKDGLLSASFFSTDRIQHIFWVTRDPLHPLYNKEYAEKYGQVIDNYYIRMDSILGELMQVVDDKTALMVFSDHGFSTFRRAVHINSWLTQNGYMTLTKKITSDDKDGGGLFQYVDWKNTRAYALGFGSIYLNLKGRERFGIVENGSDSENILDNISSQLLKLNDPQGSHTAVKGVYKRSSIYSGDQAFNAPDLIVGFNEGYRASWQTAVGGAPPQVFDDNLKKWSGDHIVDPSVVPGIFLSNFGVSSDRPSVMDIAPTVLKCFGMSSDTMEGKSLV